LKLKEYILIFLYLENGYKKNKTIIPSVKFWAITLLIIGSGLKIQMKNGHYLTIFDCFIEMEDLVKGNTFEGGDVRAWWEQHQWLRGQIKKPYWVE